MKNQEFKLTELTPKAEFELLKNMFDEYVKNPSSFLNLKLYTPFGEFINKGGFNGCFSDLWLYKKGTKGQTKKTFWRTGFGSKKSGFRVFVYDLRSIDVNKSNINEVANMIGAKVVTIDNITYFTTI